MSNQQAGDSFTSAVMRSNTSTIRFTKSALTRSAMTALLTLLAVTAADSTATAQWLGGKPKQVENVGIDEHLDAILPLDELYVDEHGKKVPLRKFFAGEKPVLITFNYSGCPKLCDAQLNGLVSMLQDIDLKPGDDFEYISMSIDPQEKPSRARASRDKYVQRYGDLDTKPGWHFLTGDEDSIELITETSGFRYEYLPERNEFSHAPVYVLCTPDGRIARYLYGIQFEPETLRLSLIEVSEGKIGSSMEQVILWCFNYDPDANAYVLQAVSLMKLGGAFTVIMIVAICVPFWFTRPKREKASSTANTQLPTSPGNGESTSKQSPTAPSDDGPSE